MICVLPRADALVECGGPRLTSPVQRIARAATRLVVAFALAIAPVLAGASAALAVPLGGVELVRSSASVPAGDPIAFSVTARVQRGTPYVEIRARLLRPGGSLVYQRTQVFNAVASDTVRADFETDLGGAILSEGRYPLEVRVRTGSGGVRTGEHLIEDRVFVYDPDKPPTPMAVVIWVGCSPSLDPEGRFIDDPSVADAALRATLDVAALERRLPAGSLSVALTPLMAEQLSRASAGFVTAGPDGIREIPADAETPARYREGLERIADALRGGRMELLTVPYSDPELRSLAAIGAETDLAWHLARGRSVTLSALQATASPVLLPAAGHLVPGATDVLADDDIAHVLLRAGSLSGAKSPAGTWRVRDTTMTALVIDDEVSAELATEGGEAALDRLFELRASHGSTTPIAAVVDVGPGRKTDPGLIGEWLAKASASGWLMPVTASSAAAAAPRGELTLAEPSKPDAPGDYWSGLAEAREQVRAFAAAAATEDPDAQAAVWALLMAESSCWAGPDGSWALADRGRAFIAAGERRVLDTFSALRVDASDLTLSGSSGRIPVVIANGSGKRLRMRLTSSSQSSGSSESRELTIEPSDNFTTIEVDLRGAVSDRVTIGLMAGDLVVSETTVSVRASVLDRIVTLGAVVLTLIGLLLFVRGKLAARGA